MEKRIKITIAKLEEMASEYIESLPDCTKPLAKRLLLRVSPTPLTAGDMGFVQYVTKKYGK